MTYKVIHNILTILAYETGTIEQFFYLGAPPKFIRTSELNIKGNCSIVKLEWPALKSSKDFKFATIRLTITPSQQASILIACSGVTGEVELTEDQLKEVNSLLDLIEIRIDDTFGKVLLENLRAE